MFKPIETRLLQLETELHDLATKLDTARAVRGDEVLMESLRKFISEEGLGGSGAKFAGEEA